MSVKLKVTLWYTAAMLLFSLFVLAAVTSIGQDMMRRDMTDRLVQTVDEMSRRPMMPNDRMPPMHGFRFYERGVHMALYDEEYSLIGGQAPFGITEAMTFAEGNVRTETYDGNKYYVYDKKVFTPDGRHTFWVKGMISAAEEGYAVRSVMRNNLILTVILILIAAAGGYFLLSRAFVPVDKISKTARAISESSDLSQRINIGKGGDEISRLANTFDEMLAKLEQTFEREKQFTSDASHELRTPVAVILSECEYMAECAGTAEEYKESALSVKRQAEKMSKLISELLMISRMDKNTLKLDFEEIDVSELLDFVCDEQEELRSSRILLKRNYPSGVIAEADRFLLTRVFINLISNAYQYSKEEGVIHVSLKEENDCIRFSVADEGIGISEEDLSRIWERFYQADPARTKDESGSMGLGLSMVKQIVECHGGSVSAESEIGVGSVFTVTLPKRREDVSV